MLHLLLAPFIRQLGRPASLLSPRYFPSASGTQLAPLHRIINHLTAERYLDLSRHLNLTNVSVSSHPLLVHIEPAEDGFVCSSLVLGWQGASVDPGVRRLAGLKTHLPTASRDPPDMLETATQQDTGSLPFAYL